VKTIPRLRWSTISIQQLYLIAYAPSSPHRLYDLAKLAFSMSIVSAFIVVRPVGVAAQTGVPEVFKLAYRLDRRFLVFPRLQDLKEMVKMNDALFIVHNVDDAPDICEINFKDRENIGVVVQAGETPFTKEDLVMGRIVKISEMDVYRAPNAVADAAIALVKLHRLFKNIPC